MPVRPAICHRRALYLAGCLVVAVFHVACGQSREDAPATSKARDGGGPGTGEESSFAASSLPTYESFCEGLTEVYCTTMEVCCGQDEIPFQREVCDGKAGRYRDGPHALCGTSVPIRYDSEAAAECLSLRARLAPSCRFRRLNDPIVLQAEDVCDRVAVHDLPGPGEVCEGLCAAPAGKISTCDHVADSADPSTCTDAVTPAKLGDPCAGGRFCEPATYCESTCRELLPDGAECIQDYECESGSCSDESAPAKRHCDEIRRVVREECLIYNEPPVRWSGSRYESWSDGGYH